MTSPTLLSACLLLVLPAACGSGVRRPIAPEPFEGNAIQAAELRAVEAHTAYEAIYRLRAFFFTRRRGGEEPIVVLDGVPLGGINVLQALPAGNIVRIERISALEAAIRLGTRANGAGAILVWTGHPRP